MALEEMRDEMIRRLHERSATQVQITVYEEQWKEAMRHSGKPLPCPLCFLNGRTCRLKSISDVEDVGITKCEDCRTIFEFPNHRET